MVFQTQIYLLLEYHYLNHRFKVNNSIDMKIDLFIYTIDLEKN